MIDVILVKAASAASARAALLACGLFVEGEDGRLLPVEPGAGYEDYGGAGISPPPEMVDGEPVPVEVDGYHVNVWCQASDACTAARVSLEAAGVVINPEPGSPWCCLSGS